MYSQPFRCRMNGPSMSGPSHCASFRSSWCRSPTSRVPSGDSRCAQIGVGQMPAVAVFLPDQVSHAAFGRHRRGVDGPDLLAREGTVIDVRARRLHRGRDGDAERSVPAARRVVHEVATAVRRDLGSPVAALGPCGRRLEHRAGKGPVHEVHRSKEREHGRPLRRGRGGPVLDGRRGSPRGLDDPQATRDWCTWPASWAEPGTSGAARSTHAATTHRRETVRRPATPRHCPKIFRYSSGSTFGLRSYVMSPLISCSTSVSCV